MRVPGDVYRKSESPFPKESTELSYPEGFLKRKVATTGWIGIEGIKVTISTSIAGWHVGLKPCGPDGFLVWFGSLCLGLIDMPTQAFKPADRRAD